MPKKMTKSEKAKYEKGKLEALKRVEAQLRKDKKNPPTNKHFQGIYQDPNQPITDKAQARNTQMQNDEMDRNMKNAASKKRYAKGGKVRGCGIARKGVRKAKMR